jgi:hypothetical protein
MQQALETESQTEYETNRPEHDAVRQAAADAVEGIETRKPHGGFAAESDQPPAASRSGRWRAHEPGQELVPPPAQPRAGLRGRLGPAVPSIPPPAELLTRPPLSLMVQPGADPTTLARDRLLLFPDGPGVATTREGYVVVTVSQSLHVRIDRLCGALPRDALEARPVLRRSRGRDLDEPLGGGGARFALLEGGCNYVLSPASQNQLVALELSEEFLYVCETHLVAFDGGVRHENGRLHGPDGESTPLVQLSGRGSVVIESRPGLAALQVSAERPLLIRHADVVGWTGRLLTQPLGGDATPPAPGLVRFSGDGAVFLNAVTR